MEHRCLKKALSMDYDRCKKHMFPYSTCENHVSNLKKITLFNYDLLNIEFIRFFKKLRSTVAVIQIDSV